MAKSKILAFAGSTRTGSWNDSLVRIAAEGARQTGAEVTVISLKDYPLPLFDQDLEQDQGPPENATRLKELFLDHDGLLIASPEYNSSITPLLKNAIDWVSRPSDGEPMLAAYQDKVAALVSASPGALGGLRGLVHVRSILSNIGVIVIPDQVAIPKAFEAFDASGQLVDEKLRKRAESVGASLSGLLNRLVV